MLHMYFQSKCLYAAYVLGLASIHGTWIIKIDEIKHLLGEVIITLDGREN